jgi:hypothetical protein
LSPLLGPLKAAIALGIATPFASGILAWDYLDPHSRTGFWYYWLCMMPDNFTALLPYAPSPGGRFLVAALGYAAVYLLALVLAQRLIRRLRGTAQSGN